jgi:hypothetical protein
MNNIRFGENIKVQPILAPADIVDSATPTGYVDLRDLHWATLALHFGAITCDVPTVTLEASTAASSNATELAVAFYYRLSGVVGTDTMGSITSATTTGAALVVTDDGKVMFIEVDPQAIAALGDDYRYVRAVITPAENITACVVGAVSYGEKRYPGNTVPSS